MRSAWWLLLAALLVLEASGRELLEGEVKPSIVGGTPAPRGRWPAIASLRYSLPRNGPPGYDLREGELFCGATLIHPQVVITSASCTRRWNVTAEGLIWPYVRLREYERNGGLFEQRSVIKTMFHKKFSWDLESSYNPADDIALMLLDTPVTYRPVKIPAKTTPSPAVANGTLLVMLGWGKTEPFDLQDAPELNMADTRLQTQEYCALKYPWWNNWSTKQFTCAAFPGHKKNTCYRDLGGPLLLKGAQKGDDLLVGIGSWTFCDQTMPAGFTNTAFYARWIRRGIQVLLGQVPPSESGPYTIWTKGEPTK